MPKRSARHLRHARSAEILAAHRNGRGYELLDAVVTVAALMSRADGWIQPVERGAMLDFLERNQFLSFFTRDNILALFEDRVRDLREPDGAIVAVIRLRQYAQQSSAAVGLIVEMARVIAVADGRMDPREQSILELIGSGFEAELSSLAPRYRPEGAAR
jgi:tellurite resistance protein